MSLSFQAISKGHNRRDFDCGEPALNKFLQTVARQSHDNTRTRTFVLVDKTAPTQILGYYTLVLGDLELPPDSALYQRFGGPPPCVRLARLAVDKRYQGQCFSEILLVSLMKKIRIISENAGVAGCFVDAKNERVKQFYINRGFAVACEAVDPLCLWLPIKDCVAIAAS